MLVVRDLHSNVPYGSNCYLISSNGEFAVIDPSLDYYEAVKQYPEILHAYEFRFRKSKRRLVIHKRDNDSKHGNVRIYK